MRSGLVLSIIALVLALHKTSALALDPCAYIDQSEAAAILGEAVKEGRAGTVSGFAGGLSCTYFTAAPLAQRGGTGSIQLVIHEKSTMKDSVYDDPQKFFDKMLEASRKSRPEKILPVDGVGEMAVLAERRRSPAFHRRPDLFHPQCQRPGENLLAKGPRRP